MPVVVEECSTSIKMMNGYYSRISVMKRSHCVKVDYSRFTRISLLISEICRIRIPLFRWLCSIRLTWSIIPEMQMRRMNEEVICMRNMVN